MMTINDHWKEIEEIAALILPGEPPEGFSAGRGFFCAGYEAGMRDVLRAATKAEGSRETFQALLAMLQAQSCAFLGSKQHDD